MSQAGAKLKRLFYHVLVVLSIDSSCDCSDQHEFWGDDTDQCWDESAPDERAPNRTSFLRARFGDRHVDHSPDVQEYI